MYYRHQSIFELIYNQTQHGNKMRPLFILLIISLQFLLGWLYYTDHTACCTKKVPEKVLRLTSFNSPLLFNWSLSEPIVGADWQRFKDSLVDLVNDTAKMEITAWYCMDEVGPIPPETFGLARLNAVRALFTEVADNNIILITREVRCDSLDKTSPFEAAGFSIRKVTKSIIETENETTIYFPVNSTGKLKAADVENYLDKVAVRVIASGESILLTSYTDALIPEETNVGLCIKRAEIIRDHLASKGVPDDKIIVKSNDEKSPVAGSTAYDGQAKNIRTTLRIIP